MTKLFNKRTGAINELKAQQHYLAQGWDVFTPVMPTTRADFVCVKGGKVKKVQVKTAQRNGAHIQSRLDVHGKRYTAEEVDEVVFIFEDRMWIAPIKDIDGFPSVCLGKVNIGSPYKPQVRYNPDDWKINVL